MKNKDIVLGGIFFDAVEHAKQLHGPEHPLTTAHILLAIIWNKENKGYKMLEDFGLDMEVNIQELKLRIARLMDEVQERETDHAGQFMFSRQVYLSLLHIESHNGLNRPEMIPVYLIEAFTIIDGSIAGKVLGRMEIDRQRVHEYIRKHGS